jgi:hypothetical protein
MYFASNFRRVVPAILAELIVWSSIGWAQAGKPVYVQYEGFTKSGAHVVLSFGYYNMNDVNVVIPPGERNGFSPAPADRGQPTTFLTGRHQSACVMVFPEGFDGNLRWRVENGGQASETSARVLDPNYALTEAVAGRATAGLDLDAIPPARCQTPQPPPQRR